MKLLFISIAMVFFGGSQQESETKNVEDAGGLWAENSTFFMTTCSSGCLTVLVTVSQGPFSYYRDEFNAWRSLEQASCKMPSLSSMP